MKTTAVLVFIACCVSSALSLAEDNKKPPASVFPAGMFSPGTTITSPKPTTTKPTTTTPTTTTPTTTTPTTTTPTTTTPTTTTPTTTTPTTTTPTTTKPTTTKPTTTKPTTTKPTTTKPTTTTATTTTATTTTATTTTATTTTPAPATTTPAPSTKVLVGTYSLMNGKQVCLKAQMALQIRLVTPKANGTFIVQPNVTTVKGECKDPKANLTLSFPQGFITFLFFRNATDESVYVNALSFVLNYPLGKGVAGINSYKADNKTHLFAAKTKHSYSCKTESVFMGNGLHLDVSQDRVQAFNFSTSNDFGTPDLCPADKPDYRVAIAVGVTLLVLIVIVVVAYLVGRRRRSDGYQSL